MNSFVKYFSGIFTGIKSLLGGMAVTWKEFWTKKVTMEYPHNPSGSEAGVAGICDNTGRVFGLILHPEAYVHPTNHPQWTNGEQAPLGTLLFENAVKHLQQ